MLCCTVTSRPGKIPGSDSMPGSIRTTRVCSDRSNAPVWRPWASLARVMGWPDLRLFLFHGALQRMLVAAGEIHHLPDLGFRDLVTEHPNDGDALLVHGQHDF